jgi:hypothetical protein
VFLIPKPPKIQNEPSAPCSDDSTLISTVWSSFALLLERRLARLCPSRISHQQLCLNAIATLGHVVHCVDAVSFQPAFLSSSIIFMIIFIILHLVKISSLTPLNLRSRSPRKSSIASARAEAASLGLLSICSFELERSAGPGLDCVDCACVWEGKG